MSPTDAKSLRMPHKASRPGMLSGCLAKPRFQVLRHICLRAASPSPALLSLAAAKSTPVSIGPQVQAGQQVVHGSRLEAGGEAAQARVQAQHLAPRQQPRQGPCLGAVPDVPAGLPHVPADRVAVQEGVPPIGPGLTCRLGV